MRAKVSSSVLCFLCNEEFLDEVQMRASIQYSKLEGFLEEPTLFLEFNGSETSVEEQAKAVGKSAFTIVPSSPEGLSKATK